MSNQDKLINEYIGQIRATLAELPTGEIEQMADIIQKARMAGSRVFIFGNGGSAATAAHFAGDLNKGANCPGQPRIRAIALTDNIPAVTAWANDAAYEDVFAEQLENHVEAGDVVIGISGSGRSMNVVKALKLANNKGATTVALTGFDGGLVKDVAHLCLTVPNSIMEQVEDVHLLIEHVVTTCLRAR